MPAGHCAATRADASTRRPGTELESRQSALDDVDVPAVAIRAFR